MHTAKSNQDLYALLTFNLLILNRDGHLFDTFLIISKDHFELNVKKFLSTNYMTRIKGLTLLVLPCIVYFVWCFHIIVLRNVKLLWENISSDMHTQQRLRSACASIVWSRSSLFIWRSPCYLTHCRLNELPHTIYWKILILIWGMSAYVI